MPLCWACGHSDQNDTEVLHPTFRATNFRPSDLARSSAPASWRMHQSELAAVVPARLEDSPDAVLCCRLPQRGASCSHHVGNGSAGFPINNQPGKYLTLLVMCMPDLAAQKVASIFLKDTRLQ